MLRSSSDRSLPQTASARLSTLVWGWTAVAVGLSFLAFHPDRFSGPAFLALTEVPGWPVSAGCGFLAVAMLLLVGQIRDHYTIRNVGIRALQALCLGFAGSFGYAVAVDRRAGVIGLILFVAVAVQLEIVRRLRRKEPAHDAADR